MARRQYRELAATLAADPRRPSQRLPMLAPDRDADEIASARAESAPPFITFAFPETLPMRPTGRARRGRELRVATTTFNIDIILWSGHRLTIATVEEGFESDGVSRPSLLRGWLDPWGDEAKAAVLHDWLLELIRRRLIGLPKIVVDLVFMLALICTGTSFPRAAWMFLGVRTRPFRSAL